jgi:hypothetical protein
MSPFPVLLSIFFLFLGSCNQKGQQKADAKPTAVTSTIKEDHPQRDADLYTIHLGAATLSLQQWDSTINLNQLLGQPLKSGTRQMDKNADTHASAFIKTVEYPGLKLQLFSPPQNGRHFWVMEMTLTSGRYRTSKGITLGSAFDSVQKAYPSLQPFPGNNKNMYYVAEQGYEKSMEMEFRGNRVKKLRLYYMLQ